MVRRNKLWILLMVLVLLAAACNTGDGDEEQTDDEAQEQEGGEAIEVAAVWTDTEQERFTAVLDAFTDETGIETSYRSSGDDMAAFLGTQIEGGSPPDVAVIAQPALVQQLAGDGSLQPLDEDVVAGLDENFASVWKDIGSVDGEPYAVYFKVANKSTWWYNTAVFQQAGVEPPQDWDEMLETAQTVNASGTPWVSIGGADGWTLTDLFENIYLRTAGPEKYDQLATHEIPWTDPSVKEALTQMGKMLGDKENIAGGTSGALQTDFPTSVTQVFAQQPKAAMIMEGDFVAGVIQAETQAQPQEGFDVFDFPSIGQQNQSVALGAGDVVVMFKDNPAARALIEYLGTPEAQEIWAKRGGFTAPSKNVNADVYPDEITRKAAVGLGKAEEFRFDLSDLQPAEFGGDRMFTILQDFLKNPSDVNGTAQRLEKAAAAAYKKA